MMESMILRGEEKEKEACWSVKYNLPEVPNLIHQPYKVSMPAKEYLH